uniref:Uncharacterized protein n=1 Tax=Oryza brachyantha TaxID=4533 RepID=J3LL70_ORYBR
METTTGALLMAAAPSAISYENNKARSAKLLSGDTVNPPTRPRAGADGPPHGLSLVAIARGHSQRAAPPRDPPARVPAGNAYGSMDAWVGWKAMRLNIMITVNFDLPAMHPCTYSARGVPGAVTRPAAASCASCLVATPPCR